MTHASSGDRNSGHSLWREGAIGGLVAAVVYTAFVEIVNVAANGLGAFFVPFRQIGAMLLGPQALDPAYSVVTATLAGTVIHFALAAAFGILVAWIANAVNTRSASVLIALGALLGLGLYALNVFVIFPATFPWFLANDRLAQSVGHALFGGVTGAWLAWRQGGNRGGTFSD